MKSVPHFLRTGDTRPTRLQVRMLFGSHTPNGSTVFPSLSGCSSCVIGSPSDLVAERAAVSEQEQSDRERDAMTAAHFVALQLISAHQQVAHKALMTYNGVHLIHQFTELSSVSC